MIPWHAYVAALRQYIALARQGNDETTWLFHFSRLMTNYPLLTRLSLTFFPLYIQARSQVAKEGGHFSQDWTLTQIQLMQNNSRG